MTDLRSDERLDRALAELRPVVASARFNPRTLARLRRVEERRMRHRRLLAAAAAVAAMLALALGLGWWSPAAPPSTPVRPDQALRQARELRRELEALRREADALQTPAADDGAVFYLGGDDSVDVVLDLRPYADAGALDARPASWPPRPDRDG